jgi:LPS export ABC transporter protein LptC
MLTWQKRLRAALAVLILVVGAAVFLALRTSRRPAEVPPPSRIDSKAAVEAQGRGVYTRTADGRTIFTLTFDRQLAYPDGRTELSGVELVLPNRNGRTFRVKAKGARRRDAEPGKELGAVTFDGGVIMTGDDGLRVETDSAAYDEKTRVVRANSKVTFSRGRTSGTGMGATYDEATDTFTLLDQARIVVAPDEAGQGAMTINSSRAALGRTDRVVRLEGGVTVVGSPQSATAETAIVRLTPQDTTDRIDLTGRATVTGDDTGPFRSMRGDTIVLDYGADGKTLERSTLTGTASADLSSASGARTLSGNSIDATLGSAGQTVTGLTASGNVVLTLPADAASKSAARTVKSATLKGSGDDSGINALSFGGGVDYREAAAATPSPASARSATSEALEVTLEPGFGALKDARFRGRVIFRDGTTRAEAPEARHAIDRGVLHLSGPQGGPLPRVVDERVSVDARAIELTTGTKKLNAKGDVRSVLQAQKSTSKDRRMPAMLERDKPVNVTSNALAYDGDAGQATYTGKARLWQGDTSVQGEVLVLDDKQGHLNGKGGVVSRLMLEEKPAKPTTAAAASPKPIEPVAQPGTKKRAAETLARGDTLAYDNNTRRAVYDGHAHFTGPEGDVSGDRIELFLDESGRMLERAEAYGKVNARFEGGHRANGARLTYLAETEHYTMHGTPVRILEKVSDGCRETAGATLTFLRSTDTISVVGNTGGRSRTTPGSCAEPPR